MAHYFQSTRHLWNFWEEKLLKLHELKIKNGFILVFEDGKNLIDKLEEYETLEKIEIFVYDTCQKIYNEATQNITPFPDDWNVLLDELPVGDGYHSFIQEYSQAKNEVIENYHWNLENKNIKNQAHNFTTIIGKLLKVLRYKLNEGDFPPKFDGNKEYKQLSTVIFRDLKKKMS